jgi:hypothetical protein
MQRTITVDGQRWEVGPTGRVTQYTRDEFGIEFRRADPAGDTVRIARYTPLGARSWELSLTELSDQTLQELFRRSQPSWTAPETGYRR